MITESQRELLESYICEYGEARYLHQEEKTNSAVKSLLCYLYSITLRKEND